MESQPVTPKARSWADRAGDWLGALPTPEAARRNSIALAVIVTIAALAAFAKTGMLGNSAPGVGPTDLSLNGTWKIKYDDKPEYARADLPDRDWCLINVPTGGEPTKGTGDEPAKDCPKEVYPREKMRNSTYWYRRTVEIPEGMRWEKPSLFIGNVKQEGWVYWDGQLIGNVRLENLPLMVLIPSSAVSSGRHILAIKVTSGGDQYPGLYHAMARGVAIGEHTDNIQAIRSIRQHDFLEPFAVVLIQVSALLVVLFLTIRMREPNEAHFWLLLYLGGAAVYASSGVTMGEWRWFLNQSSWVVMSLSLVGMGIRFQDLGAISSTYVKRVGLGYMFALLAVQAMAFAKGNPNSFAAASSVKVVSIGAAFAMVFGLLNLLVLRARGVRSREYSYTDVLSYSALGMLHLAAVASAYMDSKQAVFMHLPVMTGLVTFCVILAAIENHVNKERQLAFFGRFIRRGLKDLLVHNRKNALNGEKIVQARQVPVMKIDIVGHTQATYGMPYGLKREFQDLWFTHVDEVVAERIFLDKSQGDGSFYYFDESIAGGSCNFAIQAALRISENTVAEFDREFSSRVAQKVKEYPELAAPLERFKLNYASKSGQSFEHRSTKVRIALVYGFVDEGLWGLHSQGHYDVEGDLLTLAARLEPNAGVGEIVLSDDFYKRWVSEIGEVPAHFEVTWREIDLKGIGLHRFATLRRALPREKKSGEAA